MYYCSDFNSKVVLSLYEGELIGTVNKMYFDKKMKKLISLELISEDGARLTLPSKNIYRVGKNALTVKNNQAVSIKIDNDDLIVCPIESKAYSLQGEFLGLIKEISINDKFLTEKFSLDNNGSLDVNRLASCSKNTAIFFAENEKFNLNKFIPQKSPESFKTPEIQNVETLPIVDQPIQKETAEEIRPKIQSSDFLIGRLCTKDIYNFNNELLIKAHTIINKKNLKEISRYGKLRELMLFSK